MKALQFQSRQSVPASIPNFHLGHNAALDGLRGIAVLAVTAGHFQIPVATKGSWGVDIFFALSGFLITTILAEEWIKTGGIQLKKFYIRRVLRLYPALLLMLLLVAPLTSARIYILSTLTYVTNWVMALHLRPINMELGHTWSLAIEEQYYLLWPPLLLFLLRRFPARKVILLPLSLGILSAGWRVIVWLSSQDMWRYYAGTDTHADGLLLGSALGLAAVFGLLPNWERVKGFLPWVTSGAIALALWVTVIIPQPDGLFADFGTLMVVVTTLLIIASLVVYPSPWIIRFFEFKPLVFLGVIS